MNLQYDQYLVETKERARFFQTVQAWPLDEDLDFDGWLSNFSDGEEKFLASQILDFFNHYSEKMVIQMLKTSVANSGYKFINHFADWRHTDFQERCIYSFIPGETLNPTDSGHIFSRYLRDQMDIPENRIIRYEMLAQVLDGIASPTPIVFVDDFVGSGNQVLKAWSVNEFSYNRKTLSRTCQEGDHCAVYAPLIVNHPGHKVIINQCVGLHLSAAHILGPEYNLFDHRCICWKQDPDLYKKGTTMIFEKSKLLGIPSTGGKVVTDEMGYGAQGLAISFRHGAPDAIPSFFYWNNDSWKPLIRKVYER